MSLQLIICHSHKILICDADTKVMAIHLTIFFKTFQLQIFAVHFSRIMESHITVNAFNRFMPIEFIYRIFLHKGYMNLATYNNGIDVFYHSDPLYCHK